MCGALIVQYMKIESRVFLDREIIAEECTVDVQ